jgi:hypothetical protein
MLILFQIIYKSKHLNSNKNFKTYFISKNCYFFMILIKDRYIVDIKQKIEL